MPDATNRPASLPRSSAARALEGVDRRVVAEDVVAELGIGHRRRIAGDGCVTVSLRRSIRGMGAEYGERVVGLAGSADRLWA